MKILHFVDSYSPLGGGSQIIVLHWLSEFSRNSEFEVMVVSNQSNVPFPVKKHLHIQLPTISLSAVFPQFPVAWILPPDKEKKILSWKPDLIHLHEPHWLSFAFLELAKKHNIPILVHYHTNYGWYVENMEPPQVWLASALLLLQEKMLQRANKIITPTKYWQQYLKKEYNGKILTVPYCVDLAYFSQHSTKLHEDKPVRLISVSRLAKEKRLDVIIQALTHLPTRYQLTIVGDGIDKKRLERLVESLDLSSRVKFAGWNSPTQQKKLYHSHHLFVSASDFETFGLTYIESLATGTPCLVYDFEVPREVIPVGMAEYVRTHNPEVWAEKIRKTTQLDRYTNLVESVRDQYQKLDRFTPKNSAQQMTEVYKQTILGHHKTSM